MNGTQLIGNISTDIDLRATPSGKFVASFNLAVNNPFNREKTIFLPVEIWGAQAENTSNYCKKGSKVGVTGYIDMDQWEKDGQRRSKVKIVGNSIEFLTPKGNNTPQQNNTNTQPNLRIDEDPFSGDIDLEGDLPF